MNARHVIMGGVAATLLLLLTLVGITASTADPEPPPGGPTAACEAVYWSPTQAPAGSNFFGDGRSLVGSTAEELKLHFIASANCDPFQLSVREMIWNPEKYPDEAARHARQQQLASDLEELTAATRNMVDVVNNSEFSVDNDWTGEYETLFAAHTQDGWHAYKLSKSMAGQQILVQKTKGGRELLWKVECLFQPVARVLKGFPSGPPSNRTPPPPGDRGYTPGTVPPGTVPPGTGTRPPTTRPPTTRPTTTQPPHTTPPTTGPKCTGGPEICGTNNSGPEQQPVQENNPEQVAPTPGYTPGGAEEVDETQHGSGENPTPHGTDSGGGGGSSPGGSGSGSNGGSGGNAGTGNPEDANPTPGQQNPPGDPGGW